MRSFARTLTLAGTALAAHGVASRCSKSTTAAAATTEAVGISSIQGRRRYMEDTFVSVVDDKATHASFFAVYDGHGGPQASLYAQKHLHTAILKALREDGNGRPVDDLLRDTFLRVDREYIEFARHPSNNFHPRDGTTACTVLMDGSTLYCANAGDSRAVARSSTSGHEVIALSQDHKPDNKEEHDRIYATGGFVKGGRIQGMVNVSRGLGDFFYKNPTTPQAEQWVTSLPDVTRLPVSSVDTIVIGTDGLWDVLSNEDAIAIACQHRPTMNAQAAAEALTRIATERDSSDNITVIVVYLRGSSGKSDGTGIKAKL